MKNTTAFLVGKRRLELRDTPVPAVKEGEVLVEVKHIGICGSDLAFFDDPTFGGVFSEHLPIVLGHECAGVVAEVGKGVKGLNPGDPVAVEPGVPCGGCGYCLGGRYNLCPDVRFLSAPPFRSGALSRYLVHPAERCFKLPQGMDTLDGAMLEPLAVGMYAAQKAGASLYSSVLILGSGCIGMMTAMACRAMGASEVIMADLYEKRLAMAREIGASAAIDASREKLVDRALELTGGHGADLVFETAGSSATIQMAPGLVKRGGKIILVGTVHEPVPFSFGEIGLNENDILTVFRYRNIYPYAIAATAAGRLRARQVVTDQYPFEQVQEAFERALLHKSEAVKVALTL